MLVSKVNTFAGVLGGVMGIVCTVVFAVLSSFVNFI